MTKWRNLPRLLSLALSCLCWLLLLGSLVYGIFTARACFGLLTSDNLTETFVSGLSLGYMRFYSETGGIVVSQEALLKMNSINLVVYFLQIPLICYGIHLLRKLLVPISQGRPFSGTVKILTKLGWFSLLVAVIQNATKWGMIHVSEYDYMISNLFLGSVITDVSFQFTPDFTFLVTAVVFFLLSCVFRCGESLQQLSDETL